MIVLGRAGGLERVTCLLREGPPISDEPTRALARRHVLLDFGHRLGVAGGRALRDGPAGLAFPSYRRTTMILDDYDPN